MLELLHRHLYSRKPVCDLLLLLISLKFFEKTQCFLRNSVNPEVLALLNINALDGGLAEVPLLMIAF